MEEKRSLPGNLELFGGFYAMYLPRTRFCGEQSICQKV